MKLLPFKSSKKATLGVEIELQIIDQHSFGLISKAKELLRNISQSELKDQIKPEITQSMLEINTSIHHDPLAILTELREIQEVLIEEADKCQVYFCGGGTHPFQKWALQKIFPTPRYRKLSYRFKYLSKRSTVFGQHVHVGCSTPDEAIYLTHALSRYVPHFIAICASSPFYQGVDTGYQSSRSTVFNAFPLSGVMPFFTNWEEFSSYYYKMKNLKIIESMKDIYWDIRPKPEYGTVEVRVCDTPLTLKKAVILAAYLQAVCLYLIEERPEKMTPELYYAYAYNRFQASRYGFQGNFINTTTGKHCLIKDDMLDTIKKIERYANQFNSMPFISLLLNDVIVERNDTLLLRQYLKEFNSFPKVVQKQCEIWAARD